MAWNEPGSGKQRDPWKDGGNSGPSPDFDALARRLRDFFNRLFGGGGGGVAIALVGALIAWCAWDSMVRVNASDTGVVLRFGRFSRLMTPGINFKFPRPVESVVPVPIGKTLQTNDQVRMLTKDENIVLVDFNVQYRISDPRLFLFGVRDPDGTLGQAAESAVRTVIGGSDMDTILSGQRSELMVQAKQLLQANLDQYKAGLSISELNFQNVRPPQDVKDAFDDANRALQDKQRAEEEAKAYASQVVPEARGDAAAVRAEAEGYKSKVTARAEGDAQRFNLVESQYKAAPEVTRKRLYIEAMEQVVGNTPKVIDLSSGKNILNLPGAADVRVPAATIVTPDPGKGGR
ncbi:FtsH protease activity modulator HflK [Dokdonella fugitiva]|jgi:membrane protease subunit HflK|uniref:Protein HflK n=1 Tax=Dokdonella fugitiva TaxID=328517 RepID=A0A4R2HXN1_9GAMM|nr:FtsH protease activity modulator HflK [Dokdonella fugitiva]MBA8885632.1 membrane protease subunit HflK [Dokdonella fugitiva]TCO36284.1 membrane protease subunit HflK [Dokdonella fugitiva]